MKKKVLVIVLAAALCFCMTACGGGSEQETSEPVSQDTPMDGSWEFVGNEAAELPEDIQKAFDKAQKAYGDIPFTPVAYIATQVVAGSNYMILCQVESRYKMVVLYQDLEGNAEFTHVNDFDLNYYVNGDSTEVKPEEMTGGWSVPEDHVGTTIEEGPRAAFDKAAEKYDGITLEPLALLANQVVAGYNYAFLCCSNPEEQDERTGIQLVTVYEDTEGNAEFTSVKEVDPADFNQ